MLSRNVFFDSFCEGNQPIGIGKPFVRTRCGEEEVFLVLQALSGVFLSVDWLLGIHRRAGDAIKENIPHLLMLWDMILVDIHYGLGVGGAFYHILLGVAAIGVATSGLMIFSKIRARQKL